MGRSFLSFAKRYCAAEHNGFGWVTDGASNLEELRVQLHGVMLRRTKDEVLDLPPKLRSRAPVTVPEGTGQRRERRVLEVLAGGRARARRENPQAGLGGAPGPPRPGVEQDRVRLLASPHQGAPRHRRAKAPRTIEFVEGGARAG